MLSTLQRPVSDLAAQCRAHCSFVTSFTLARIEPESLATGLGIQVLPQDLILGRFFRLYTPDVLTNISGHWSSNESLSKEIVESLCASRQHMAGYTLCNELYKIAVDLAIYSKETEFESLPDLGG